MSILDAVNRWLGFDCTAGEPVDEADPLLTDLRKLFCIIQGWFDGLDFSTEERVQAVVVPLAEGLVYAICSLLTSSSAAGEAGRYSGPFAEERPAPAVPPTPAGAGQPLVDPGLLRDAADEIARSGRSWSCKPLVGRLRSTADALDAQK